MLWNWKQEKSIIGVPAVKAGISHFVTDLTAALNLPLYSSLRKFPANNIFAVANIQKTSHFVTAPTGIFNCLNVKIEETKLFTFIFSWRCFSFILAEESS